MDPTIDQYNFFKYVKLTDEGYLECRLETYAAPNEDGIDQYKTFLVIGLDNEGRLKITQKP